MTFKTAIVADGAVFCNTAEFATPMLHTPANGDPETVCNIVPEFGDQYGFTEVGTGKVATFHGQCSQSNPVIDDKFTPGAYVNGEFVPGEIVWLVALVPVNDGVMWKASVNTGQRAR